VASVLCTSLSSHFLANHQGTQRLDFISDYENSPLSLPPITPSRSYRTIEQAKKAIEQANGMFIGNKPVVVMLHIKKDQRRMQKLVMKETMGATLQTRPNYNIASSQSQFKLQQGSHLHQNMLDGPYASKGNRLGLGHHTPGHHNQGHHVPGHHNHNQGHNTPGGLGYEHPTRGLSHPGRPGQGQGFPQELAEYQREYESNQTDMYMARKNPYPQDLPWDGYPNRHSHLEERFAAQQNSTQFFQHGKKLPTPVDMYGPMMALDKRQRALQQRSELYEASRASPDHPSFDPSLLSAAGKINQWGERERERGPESYSTSRSSATSRSTATPPLFLQDQQQWMDLGSPTTHDLNYSPSSWTPTLSPRGGPSTPSYDSYGFATGKAIVSPRTSYTQDRERESITTSSNQSSMIDQLPDIISRRPSVISADADRERPQFPLDRPFTAHSIGRQSSPLQRDSLGPLPGQGAGQGAGGCFLLAEPGMQRSQLSSRLLPLVEAKSSHARKITDYLVLNAPYNELQQLLETPDLLLPHYISAALSKMGA
jgi:hypothetical protein